MTEYLGATKKRKEKSAIVREMLVEAGVAFMRNRTKPILTSWAIRCQGNKRKWTKLDRALTDRQAHALDQAFSAWLITAGKSKSVDATAVHGGSGQERSPLNERELYQVARFRAAIANWPGTWKWRLEQLFSLIAPWAENQNLRPDAASIAQIVKLAKQLEKIY